MGHYTSDQKFVYPLYDEIAVILDGAYQHMVNRDDILFLDTAFSYGTSEELIGRYFEKNPGTREKTFIGTKWGEHWREKWDDQLKEWKQLDSLEYSVENLKASAKESFNHLGRIDLLSVHMPGDKDEVYSVLNNESIIREMEKMKKENKYGIKYIGASISNADVLKKALQTGFLEHLDVIQMSSEVFLNEDNIVQQIVAKGIPIVINSPARKKQKEISEKEAFQMLFKRSEAGVVLNGSRTHFIENISYLHELAIEDRLPGTTSISIIRNDSTITSF